MVVTTKKNPEDSLSDLIQTLLIYIFHSRRGFNIWEYWGDKYESYPYSNNSLIEERLHRLFELLTVDFSKYEFFFADLIKLYKSPYFVIYKYSNMNNEKSFASHIFETKKYTSSTFFFNIGV